MKSLNKKEREEVDVLNSQIKDIRSLLDNVEERMINGLFTEDGCCCIEKRNHLLRELERNKFEKRMLTHNVKKLTGVPVMTKNIDNTYTIS